MMKSPLRNESGLLTLDFVFASVLVFGFAAILFSFAFTFSIVEVVQYISFSSARNYALAHKDETSQKARAQAKVDELTSSPALVPLVSNGWFEIGTASITDFTAEFAPDPTKDSDTFQGVRIPFGAPILFKRIPLLGDTASDPKGFTANIQSFLAREPTFEECQGFAEARAGQLATVARFPFDPNAATVIMDDGC